MRSADAPRRKSLWIAALFWLLFGIKTGAFLDTINLLALAFLAWDGFARRRLPLADPIIILIAAYGIHSNIAILLSGVWDQWHIFQPWRAIINYAGVVAAVGAMGRQGWKWDQVLAAVNAAIYLHAAIIIVTFLVPDLRFSLNSLTGFVEKSYLRSPGLTHSYGITSLVMAFPFVSVLFIQRKLLPGWAEAIGLFACFISLFLTARVGLYSLPFIGVMAAARTVAAGRLRFRHFLYPAVPVAVVALFIQANSAGWFKDGSGSGSDEGIMQGVSLFINEGLGNSLELYFSAQEGEASVQSTETIGSFLFHNSGFLDVLFGTGLYGRGDPGSYLATDISYAHFFSMTGLVGVATLIFIHVLPLLRSFGSASWDSRWVYTILMVIILVGNYKEATFFTRNLFSLWAIVVASLGLETGGTAADAGRGHGGKA